MSSSQSATQAVFQLVEQGVTAYKSGDMALAFRVLTQALQLDPNHEIAWLWLSGVVTSDAERRYCLERVVALNPQNSAAQRGLTRLPGDLVARSPLPIQQPATQTATLSEPEIAICSYPGCTQRVTKRGHTLCYQHWKTTQNNSSSQAAALLSATALGEKLGISNQAVNRLLAELGWIAHDQYGYQLTPAGEKLGGVRRIHQQNNKAYIVWPETVLSNHVLRTSVRSLIGVTPEPAAATTESELSFRKTFPATYRTTDGHMVRSRAEVMIDNWLYMAGIVHAYERQLPIEEEMYCDFYLPAGKVYIEYWGLTEEPRYAQRKEAKRALYHKYKLQLIELHEQELRSLDDYLPRLLLRYRIAVT